MPAPLWKAGQSGNPSGRKAEDHEVKRLARQYSVPAIEKLNALMEARYEGEGDKPGAPAFAIQLSAANAILDRAWGKPSQPIESKSDDGLSRDALLAFLFAARAAVAAGEGGGEGVALDGPRLGVLSRDGAIEEEPLP